MPQQLTVWTAVESIATVVAAGGAIWTLVQIAKDSRDRTRPMMTAELKAAVLTHNAELHVSNRGQSVARNVRVTFAPPLPVLEGADAHGLLTPYLQRRYSRPILTFTPGMVMDNIYTSAGQREEPVPDDFSIEFNYEDNRKRTYCDRYELSVRTLEDQTGSYPSNTDEAGMRKRRVKAIEAIARGLGRH